MDCLVINDQGKILFEGGSGILIEKEALTARTINVLELFSKVVLKQAPVFIRFEKQRLIIEKGVKEGISGVALLQKERKPTLARRMLSIIVDATSKVVFDEFSDPMSIRDLEIFYKVIAHPNESLFVAPRTSDGVLAMITLLVGLIRDLGNSPEELGDQFHLVKETELGDYPQTIEDANPKAVLSFFPIAQVLSYSGIPICSLGSPVPRKLVFSIVGNETISDVIARLFGYDSEATKTRWQLSDLTAHEVAHFISEMPPTLDHLVLDVLKQAALEPGKDIATTIMKPILAFGRDQQTVE